MPTFTQRELTSKNPQDIAEYLQELVRNLRYILSNLDETNVPQLRKTETAKLYADITLTPNDWNGSKAPYTAILTDNAITVSGVYALIPATDVTADEFTAFQNAQLMGGAQTKGELEIIAWGEKPTIDIRAMLIEV